ncbi:hypothetical protein TWF694_007731 [Orbilia ellipsospora]|uniref:Glycosyl hydrolase family 13 catalytic domain-containing protein n=1 Tax=Orbilia ellipsospora TaxID=2528407 RepID=A0AAV9XIL4_9PEZI
MRYSLRSILALLPVITYVNCVSISEWRSRKIYFALTDRFARPDDSKDACTDLRSYCGGTWKGMQSKLPYIKELGFDAIWISPIVENTSGGYHGYWAKDIYNVNQNHGTPQDLKDLVTAAHKLDIYVMVDVVVNHMGRGDISTFTPFTNDTFYHPYCLIKDYSDQDQVEKCRFAGDLPNIKTDDLTVRKIFNDWVSELVKTYGFDGLRIDTARHVEKGFYQDFLEAAGNPYAIGEVFQGDSKYVARYQDVIPGVFNYPLYYSLIRCYVQSTSFHDLVTTHDAISRDFKDPRLLGTFIDNHDVPRFMSQTSDIVRLKNALAYAMLARGIPIIYYGTEYGYIGNADPENREDLWRLGYDTSGDIWKFIKTLNTVKVQSGGLGADDHVHLMVDAGVYIFGREGGKIVVLTRNLGNTGNEKKDYCFMVQGMEKRQYRSALTSRIYASGEDGRICVSMESGMPDILVALSPFISMLR